MPFDPTQEIRPPESIDTVEGCAQAVRAAGFELERLGVQLKYVAQALEILETIHERGRR